MGLLPNVEPDVLLGIRPPSVSFREFGAGPHRCRPSTVPLTSHRAVDYTQLGSTDLTVSPTTFGPPSMPAKRRLMKN